MLVSECIAWLAIELFFGMWRDWFWDATEIARGSQDSTEGHRLDHFPAVRLYGGGNCRYSGLPFAAKKTRDANQHTVLNLRLLLLVQGGPGVQTVTMLTNDGRMLQPQFTSLPGYLCSPAVACTTTSVGP